MPDPALPLLDNRTARRLFIDRHGLSADPARRQTKQDLLETIRRIGFVQVDSVNTVERAHHQILFARNQTYRKRHLERLLEKDRALFENWTHDASIIPVEFYPYWQARFQRYAERLRARWQEWRREGFEDEFETILAYIEKNGSCLSRDVGPEDKQSGGGWWDWHPSKTALEYLWRTGVLAVDRRQGFQKVYNLAERVIPDAHRTGAPHDPALIDWACSSALDRLGFATSGELAAFWDVISPDEAKAWCAAQHSDDLVSALVETVDGRPPRKVFARPDLVETAEAVPEPPGRLRVLSPFDPLIRDRKRTARLFGFQYTIEIFVPAARRQYGYYVFPLMEGDRLIGRLDMKCRRDAGVLDVTGLWLEPKVRASKGRLQKLEAELERIGRFTECRTIRFDSDWRKT